MVKKETLKFGFSLAEVMISLLIISVFFAATAKVITKKPKKDKLTVPHGYYECYTKAGTVYSHSKYEEFPQPERATGQAYCEFTPPRNAAFFNISLFGSKIDKTGEWQVVDDKEETINETVVNINRPIIYITPGGSICYDNCEEQESHGLAEMENFDKTPTDTFISNLAITYPDAKIHQEIENITHATFISW